MQEEGGAWEGGALLGALSPKFYVALTGTSSLVSGLVLLLEWWYCRRRAPPAPAACRVQRNPLALLRGAEYARAWAAERRAPLTYYDMNLSAQDHQAAFSCGAEGPAEEAMARAWRERSPSARVAAARAALAARPDCAAALLLLAEEDAATVLEAERVLRRAWRCAEAAWRAGAAAAAGGAAGAARARRDAALLAHIRRRAAMCARRLGRLRESARMFRELARDAPPALAALALHENLLELLLEQRAYADAQALLARHAAPPACPADADADALAAPAAPPSAAELYTAALLRARGAPPRSHQELLAMEALRRAIEYNPWVPEYLLEQRALALPPEHVRRRGPSEARAYAFGHLRHWRRAEPALRLLAAAWAAHPARAAPPPADADRDADLLPGEPVSRRGRGRGALLPLAAALCALAALLALLAHRWPPAALTALTPLTPVAHT